MADTWTLEFPYRRSVGPIIGGYLTGLRDGTLCGAQTKDGRVIVPPVEADPATGDDVVGLVPVADVGTVERAVWVAKPMDQHPLDHPFAWALIRLDGADTAMLHAIDADALPAVGTRVRARWRDEREGHPNDLECFVVES